LGGYEREGEGNLIVILGKRKLFYSNLNIEKKQFYGVTLSHNKKILDMISHNKRSRMKLKTAKIGFEKYDNKGHCIVIIQVSITSQ